MKKKLLGNSDLCISRIGMGAWAIGGNKWLYGWGKQNDNDSIFTIHEAVDNGINWIDTAVTYGGGHSEEVVGRAVKTMTNKPYIFTKCGIVWDKSNNVKNDLSAISIRSQVEGSLKRLSVDVIDLYQIHWPCSDEENLEGWETMSSLVKEGKVRHIGVSNFSIDQMKSIQKIAPITSLQPPYSLVATESANKIIPYCDEQTIGVINYSPMGSGLLTGKMNHERLRNLSKDDLRHNDENFKEPKFSKNLELVNILSIIAEDHDATIAEIAIAWTLANPTITGAIVGMRKADQIQGIIGASDIELSQEELSRIEDFCLEFIW